MRHPVATRDSSRGARRFDDASIHLRVILLLTASYPFGLGEQFLETEVALLARDGHRLIIAPVSTTGARRDVPRGVIVDTSLARRLGSRVRLASRGIAQTLKSRLMAAELRSRSPILTRSPRAILRAVKCLAHAAVIRDWLDELSRRDELRDEQLLAYSYWLGSTTLGAVLAREAVPNIRVISRAHGGDLYEHRRVPPYQPFHRAILSGVDAVYTVSEDGASYLRSRFPDVGDRIHVSRLGVVDSGTLCLPSSDGIFRVVSCSFLVPIKRVELLVRALSELGYRDPNRRIEWDHIGSGPLEVEVRDLASRLLPGNVGAHFHGMLSNEQVIRFYQRNPVDLFVNVSASEGVPVSIMEAQSCGIPVLATAVGGTPEIVNSDNGYLVPSDVDPVTIASVLAQHMTSMEESERKRDASRRSWKTRYDAMANYGSFSDVLRKGYVSDPIRPLGIR